MMGNKMQQLCLRLDEDMKAWLEEEAKKEGFSSLAGYFRVHLNKLKTSGRWEIIEDDELKPLQIMQHLIDNRYCFNCFCATDNVPAGMGDQCMLFNKALNDEQDGNTPRLQECIERFGK